MICRQGPRSSTEVESDGPSVIVKGAGIHYKCRRDNVNVTRCRSDINGYELEEHPGRNLPASLVAFLQLYRVPRLTVFKEPASQVSDVYWDDIWIEDALDSSKGTMHLTNDTVFIGQDLRTLFGERHS